MNQTANAAQCDPRAYGSLAETSSVVPDIASICKRLENSVENARQLGFRAHDIADVVLGPSALNAAVSPGPQTASTSLVALINDLDAALSRIEAALSRL